MKRILLLFTILSGCQVGFAQTAASNNKWVFGYHYGLDFSAPGVPTQFATSMETIEGCSSICDNSGNLLFYSNGEEVRDRNNNVMPNGAGVLGNQPSFGIGPGSSTQGVAIVPSVSNLSQYYLFVLDACEAMPGYGGKLRYSVIDMSLNAGNGDVVSGMKNIQIGDSLCEKMFVAKGVDCNYWLMVHQIDTQVYEAYRIDGNGIAAAPVRSHTGITATFNGGDWPYACGEMKLSPDETKIVQVNTSAIQVELAYFDKVTGKVSGAVKIDSLPFTRYGVEFSSNSQMLYIGTWGGMYQYDISLLPNLTAVYNSKYEVSGGYMSGMRMGNDNKIYVISQQTQNVACINNPNSSGAGCNLTYPVTLPPNAYILNSAGLGLATVVLPQDTTTAAKDTAVCTPTNIQITAPGGYSSYLWSDGSTQQTNTFNGAGVRWVYAHINCTTLIDTFKITTPPADTTYGPTHDTTLCFYNGNTVTMNAPQGFDSYVWNDGGTQSSHTFTQAGVAWVACKLQCHVQMDTVKALQAAQDTSFSHYDTTVCFRPDLVLQGTAGYDSYLWSDGKTVITDTVTRSGTIEVTGHSGCSNHTDVYNVIVSDFYVAMRDTSICPGDAIMLVPGVAGAQYLWQDNSTAATYTLNEPGQYAVQVNLNGCVKHDTVNIGTKTLHVDLGSDQTLCINDTLQLNAHEPDCNYLWQDNSNGETYTVREAGTYWVQVTIGSCLATDTVNVAYEKCICNFFAPTAFTPNNDGRNDAFEVKIDCNVSAFKLRVFNRWGQQVFITDDVNGKWDGTFNGMPAEVGTYYYSVKYTGPKKDYFEKGDVTLIR